MLSVCNKNMHVPATSHQLSSHKLKLSPTPLLSSCLSIWSMQVKTEKPDKKNYLKHLSWYTFVSSVLLTVDLVYNVNIWTIAIIRHLHFWSLRKYISVFMFYFLALLNIIRHTCGIKWIAWIIENDETASPYHTSPCKWDKKIASWLVQTCLIQQHPMVKAIL